MSSAFENLRARLTVADVIRALELAPRSDGFACPRCGARFQLFDDATYGVSVRCLAPCRLSEWNWPEHVLADVRGIDMAEAERRLLAVARKAAAGRVHSLADHRQRAAARRTVEAFLA